MSAYVCVIECENDIVFLSDAQRINTGDHIPLRIIGLYNVQHNDSYWKRLPFLSEEQSIEAVEKLLADRYYYDRQGKEWYKVRAGNYKQRQWMEDVTIGYQNAKGKDTGYYASHRVSHLKATEVDNRPACEHGYPCEVHYSRDGTEIYFDCPVKYIWPHFMPTLERVTPCKARHSATL